ncbi:class I SAM-dependent methyltransferase [Corynebacterium cystitidis]|uniref:16S rRNA (Guanine1207-N2)-methyltransferase n=1 Tax=Corynebacterium cystitidis DSM 20524 TaxID=1121357 RepID=A0A1H9P0X2_9CORY|nr:methyltransferase [Corynebacterium cystitidis]WJY82666.1 Ribosomal RNA large subunit methyltransferase G [Corynebacterium cystitidis DSM 20524]SER41469.1 16S rRNA (guanine1207-N2)-methyltransferase [Corynebacterium cystitidis DSM 20524]SNV72077.1 Ribosomal RNA large subunit methyltransferase G [Corynebacterium cystitidis]
MRTLDALILDNTPNAETWIIVDDPESSLLQAAAGRVVSLQSDFCQAQAARAAGAEVLGDSLYDDHLRGSGIAVVVGQMPKSLERLDYVARSVSSAGFDEVTVVLGANNKHLSRGMNEVLARSFEHVHASRGRGKLRCLIASGPKPGQYQPAQRNGIVGVGGVFSGAKEDYGGQLLAQVIVDTCDAPRRVLDLGCGNGSVAKRIVEAWPDTQVTATDSDADAVVSARATFEPFGERVKVTWDDAGSQLEPGFDVIALNPPFHEGTTVDATLVQHLLDAARRLVADGGEVFVVHNSHLRYRDEVKRRFKGVKEVARNKRYTVLRAR